MPNSENTLRDDIIAIGEKLYGRGLVIASSGNLSARLDTDNILITSSGSALGNLEADNIIKVNLAKDENLNDKKLTYGDQHVVNKNKIEPNYRKLLDY